MHLRIVQQGSHQPLRLLATMAQAGHCHDCGRVILQELGFLGLLAWALDTRRTRNMDQVALLSACQESLQRRLGL